MKKYIEILHQDHLLRGYHHNNNSKNIVVMLHGFTGNKTESKSMFRKLSETLELHDVDTIRVDFMGHGESDGQFCNMTFGSLIEQAKTIINYVEKINYKNIYLLGFSMGGLVATQVLSPRIKKAVFISPAVDFYKNLSWHLEHGVKIDEETFDIGGYALGKKFILSLKNVEPSFHADSFLGESLFIVGEDDKAVSPEGVVELSKEFQFSKLNIYNNCDHLYSKLKLYERLEMDVVAFLKE